jgi:hypothetical protein
MLYVLRCPSFYVGAGIILATISLMDIVLHHYSSLIIDGSLIIFLLVLFLFVELRVYYHILPYFHLHRNTRLLSCKKYYCPGCKALLSVENKRVMDKNVGVP